MIKHLAIVIYDYIYLLYLELNNKWYFQ